MVELSALQQRLLKAAANLDEQLCELIELRQRLKNALSARYHSQKIRTRARALRSLQRRGGSTPQSSRLPREWEV
jgi:hypothetical protein